MMMAPPTMSHHRHHDVIIIPAATTFHAGTTALSRVSSPVLVIVSPSFPLLLPPHLLSPSLAPPLLSFIIVAIVTGTTVISVLGGHRSGDTRDPTLRLHPNL